MHLFDIGQVLDMHGEPPRNSLPSNSKDPGHSTETTSLQASPQHGILLGFRIRLFWRENAIGATVLAMVLSILTTIGSLFDDIYTLAGTAGVRHRFLNHDPNYTSSLTT